MTYVKLTMLTLLVYSLIPYSFSKLYLDHRILGLPISYVPFLLIFLYVFVKSGVNARIKFAVFHNIRWLLLWWSIVFLSFSYNAISNNNFHFKSFLADFLIITFYIFIVYLGQLLFLMKNSNAKQIEGFFHTIVFYMTLIVIISMVRYSLFDRSTALFFNLFNPLNYRLFEVLLLVFTIPISIASSLTNKKASSQVYVLILLGGLLMAGSRTGYVSILLTIPFMVIWGYISFAKLLKLLIPLTILGWIALYNDDIANNIHRLDMIKQYTDLNFENAVEENQVVRRVGMITGTIEMILQNPFLGVSLGKENYFSSFPSYYLNFFHVGRPHNQYLTLAATTGLIGLFTFLLFMLSIVISGLKASKNTQRSQSSYHFTRFLLLSNILIFVLMIGYEFETEPFIWMIWGLSNSYFYVVKKKHKIKTLQNI